MTSPIHSGSKRVGGESAPLLEGSAQDSLNELSRRVENLYMQNSALSSITRDSISDSLSSLKREIQIYKVPSLAVLSESEMRTLSSRLDILESSVKRSVELFEEIKESALVLIEDINMLSTLTEESLSSPRSVENVEETYEEFMLLASNLNDFSRTVQKPVLGLSLALELEKARSKFLHIREMLIRRHLIPGALERPIPEFFCNLAIYNYQKALLPTVHHLIHDKYSLNLRPGQMEAMPCRTPTGQEVAKIQAAYDELPPGIRVALEMREPVYGLREIPAGSGEYFKIRAKILRDFIIANPYLYPHPADSRTFPSFEIHADDEDHLPEMPAEAAAAAANEAVAPIEDVDVRDMNATLINVYYSLKDNLFTLSQAERLRADLLRSIFSDLELPAPFLASFYTHVRNIAAENHQLPVDAPDNWAENNAFSSYSYIEKGLFRAVSESLTDTQRPIFDTWYKLSNMLDRTEAAVRVIIEGNHYTDAQVAKFYEELIKYERRAQSDSQAMNEPGWAAANAYNDYERTRVALSAVFLHGFLV